MGFLDIFRKPNYKQGTVGIVECPPFDMDGLELQLRELAFFACINLIANKVGLCKMRQFEAKKEIEGSEYWLWNYEPNKNQSASQFWHKLVTKLYLDGDALIVDEPYGSGVVVADSFSIDDSKPTLVYRAVVVGQRTIEKLTEPHVMHIVLNNKNISPLIRKMGEVFLKLMASAQNNYLFNAGQHWKVHVAQTVSADDEWLTKFKGMLEKQIKPFLDDPVGVLPEMDGYDFTQISGNSGNNATSQEVRELYKTIWQETAKAMNIPAVLIDGTVADTSKATDRLLTDVIDPIALQITQEANRKRYTFEEYQRGDYLIFDTSSISHYDLLSNASNVEKLVGTGIWSVNEIREKLGDTAINEEWADKHYLTKNIGSVDEANEEESTK